MTTSGMSVIGRDFNGKIVPASLCPANEQGLAEVGTHRQIFKREPDEAFEEGYFMDTDNIHTAYFTRSVEIWRDGKKEYRHNFEHQ